MRYIFIVILSLVQVTLNGQNLIKNPSFEDTVANCFDLRMVNPGYPTVAMAKHWFVPSMGSSDLFGEGDFFSFCPYNDYNVFNSNYVLPQDKKNYGGFIPYTNDNDSVNNTREYLGGQLVTPLTKDRVYCFSCYLRLWTGSKYGISNIGIHLSEDSIYVPTWNIIGLEPNGKTGTTYTDTTWAKVEFEIIANGGEKYIYIGNFDTDEETDTVRNSSGMNDAAYYLIDNLSLTVCPGQLENHITVYPNPSDGHTIYIDQYADTTSEVILYNSIGQLMGYKQLPAGEYNGEAFSNLAAGVYILRMLTANGYREEEKVIVVK